MPINSRNISKRSFLPFASLFVLSLLIVPLTSSCGGGGSDNDPGTLEINISPVQFKDLNSLELNVLRIEAVMTDDLAKPGEILVISNQPDTINLVGFEGVTPKLAGRYTIYRTGYITQVRFVMETASAGIGFDTIDVTVPSGPQTGEKIITADQVMEIKDGYVTSITIALDPEHSIVQNTNSGIILKPVIRAELGAITSLPIGQYEPEEITVLFSDTATDEEITGLISAITATIISKNPYVRFYHLKLAQGANVIETQNYFNSSTAVKASVPNFIFMAGAVPSNFSTLLWGLNNTGQTGGTSDADIDAPEAWDVTTGSNSVVVAVIDTGIDLDHPDLENNIWINLAEANGLPNVDDDNNGFVDDTNGWNFVSENNNPDDDHGHGTHVAGTIGAAGNNGVYGVSPNVALMPIKVLEPSPDGRSYGTWANIFNGLTYAANNGADVSNLSIWGIDSSAANAGNFRTLYESAGTAQMLVVSIAGNAGVNVEKDSKYYVFAELDEPNLIIVGATDHNDSIASFSCFGTANVDLTAPGVNIYSTTFNGSFGYMSGTSMAAPHVSGAAALILAKYPELIGDPEGIRRRIEESVDKTGDLYRFFRTGGRLNVYNALQ